MSSKRASRIFREGDISPERSITIGVVKPWNIVAVTCRILADFGSISKIIGFNTVPDLRKRLDLL